MPAYHRTIALASSQHQEFLTKLSEMLDDGYTVINSGLSSGPLDGPAINSSSQQSKWYWWAILQRYEVTESPEVPGENTNKSVYRG